MRDIERPGERATERDRAGESETENSTAPCATTDLTGHTYRSSYELVVVVVEEVGGAVFTGRGCYPVLFMSPPPPSPWLFHPGWDEEPHQGDEWIVERGGNIERERWLLSEVSSPGPNT